MGWCVDTATPPQRHAESPSAMFFGGEHMPPRHHWESGHTLHLALIGSAIILSFGTPQGTPTVGVEYLAKSSWAPFGLHK